MQTANFFRPTGGESADQDTLTWRITFPVLLFETAKLHMVGSQNLEMPGGLVDSIEIPTFLGEFTLSYHHRGCEPIIVGTSQKSVLRFELDDNNGNLTPEGKDLCQKSRMFCAIDKAVTCISTIKGLNTSRLPGVFILELHKDKGVAAELIEGSVKLTVNCLVKYWNAVQIDKNSGDGGIIFVV